MKYTKMLGLAAVAATALMALFGTGSASATVLCKEYKTPCPKGQALGAGTTIDMSLKTGKSVTISGTGINVTCTTSTIKGTTTNEGSEKEAVKGTVEALTYEKCTGATIKVLKDGSFEAQYISPENTNNTRAHLISVGAELTVDEMGISCEYGTVAGKTMGILASDETVGPEFTEEVTIGKEEESGFLCPASVVVKGEYAITAPAKIYFKEKTAP
ncbi:MAG: hypothetical protein ACTHNP_07465 [Solirubrobacterales bacterium]